MYQVQTINTYSWYNKLSDYKACRLKKPKYQAILSSIVIILKDGISQSINRFMNE